jgi:hypothetical protein
MFEGTEEEKGRLRRRGDREKGRQGERGVFGF